MKKIIVPTDFSDASFTAYNFANQLAHSMNATLFLTHIYHPVSTDISQFATVNEQVEEVHAQKLEGLVSSLNQDWIGSFITEPLVEGVFRVGFPRIELENLSHMENALMVMGTTGMGNPLKRMFGSLSLDMIRDVACPLFLIPPKATYQELKRILFMSESFSNDRSHLLYVARMASDLGLPLSVVHFSKKENDYPVTETIHVVKQYYPELDFLIDITDTTDLREAVNQVITGNSHHLVVFSTHHRNLIEEVFHRSISEFAALRSQCPLLILNEKVKEYIAQPAR
jgi:nucleotide-binding universal stress UspA family protein